MEQEGYCFAVLAVTRFWIGFNNVNIGDSSCIVPTNSDPTENQSCAGPYPTARELELVKLVDYVLCCMF